MDAGAGTQPTLEEHIAAATRRAAESDDDGDGEGRMGTPGTPQYTATYSCSAYAAQCFLYVARLLRISTVAAVLLSPLLEIAFARRAAS